MTIIEFPLYFQKKIITTMTPSGLKSHLFVTCDYNYFSDITLVFYTLQ